MFNDLIPSSKDLLVYLCGVTEVQSYCVHTLEVFKFLRVLHI